MSPSDDLPYRDYQMAHWREEYSAALAARDRREKANLSLYNAYTKLADRTASVTTVSTHTQSPTRAENQQAVSSIAAVDSQTHSLVAPGQTPQDVLNATRLDLAEAQRSRSEIQDQLTRITAELGKLKKKSAYDGRRIKTMEGEMTHLQLRLKDRDEELRGKAKLLDDFQDELASLNLQLNMAEERKDQLQKENQELVDRWMARMGKEAEAMNDASRFS